MSSFTRGISASTTAAPVEINSTQNDITLSTNSVARVTLPNSGSPAAEVSGVLQIQDGTQGAGKVLTSDASGKASWQTPSGGGGGVSGSGVAGQLAYWDATTDIAGSSNLTWDVNTNMLSTVQINTSSVVFSGILQENTVGVGSLFMNSAGSFWGTIQNDAADTWSLGYRVAVGGIGTPVLTWTTTGVGIFNTSPASPLDIASAAATAVINVSSTNASSNGTGISVTGTMQNGLFINNTTNSGEGTYVAAKGIAYKADVTANGAVGFYSRAGIDAGVGYFVDPAGGTNTTGYLMRALSSSDNSTAPVFSYLMDGPTMSGDVFQAETRTSGNGTFSGNYINCTDNGSTVFKVSSSGGIVAGNGLLNWDSTNEALIAGGFPTAVPLVNPRFEVVASGGPAAVFVGTVYGTGGGDPIYIGARSGGSQASPTATPSGKDLLQLAGVGYNGTAFDFGAAGGKIELVANETWGATAYGTALRIQLCPTGSNSRSTVLWAVGDSGGLVGFGGNTSPGYTIDATGDTNTSGVFRQGGVTISQTAVNTGFGGASLTGGSTTYQIAGSGSQSTDAAASFPFPVSGTIRNLYAKVNAPGGTASGSSTTFTIYKNGSSTSVTVNVGGSQAQGTTVSDTAHSVSYTAGDLLSIQAVVGSTQPSSGFNVTFEIAQ